MLSSTPARTQRHGHSNTQSVWSMKRMFLALTAGTTVAIVAATVLTSYGKAPDADVPAVHINPQQNAVVADPCSVDNGGCGPNALCRSGAAGSGLISCVCKPGFKLDTGLGGCVADVSVPAMVQTQAPPVAVLRGGCDVNNGGCGSSARCEVGTAPGSVRCVCPGGDWFDISTKSCTKVDVCSVNNGNCPADSTCVRTSDGEAVCQCGPGLSLGPDGQSCLFIDPCTITNGGCPPDATCSYDRSVAHLTCTCPARYELAADAKSCVPVNLCRSDNGGCGAHGVCKQEGFEKRCECAPGFNKAPGSDVCEREGARPDAATNYMACGGLSIQDVAIGVISGRQQYVNVLKRTWLQYAPSAQILMTSAGRASPVDFVQALIVLQQAFPNAKWYLLSDDDTFLYLPNLVCLLASKDPGTPAYLGVHHCQGEGFVCQHGRPILSGMRGWVNGGAGIVVSKGLAQKMNSQQCKSWYPGNWRYQQNAADVVFACCVMDYWTDGSISHHPGFFREIPSRSYECECPGVCTMTEQQTRERPESRISYHHLSPEAIEVRRVLAVAGVSAGVSFGWWLFACDAGRVSSKMMSETCQARTRRRRLRTLACGRCSSWLFCKPCAVCCPCTLSCCTPAVSHHLTFSPTNENRSHTNT